MHLISLSLAEVLLFSWASHFTPRVPPSIQGYKWVLANCWVASYSSGILLCRHIIFPTAVEEKDSATNHTNVKLYHFDFTYLKCSLLILQWSRVKCRKFDRLEREMNPASNFACYRAMFKMAIESKGGRVSIILPPLQPAMQRLSRQSWSSEPLKMLFQTGLTTALQFSLS